MLFRSLLFEVLFTFPSQYWFAIGLSGVFSLTGWSPLIRTGFLVSCTTQDTDCQAPHFAYRIITVSDRIFQYCSAMLPLSFCRSFYPGPAETEPVWALPRSLATTCGIILIFSSYG